MLREIQERVLAGSASTVVLVEGMSDALAVEAAARRCGIDLQANGVEVLPMGGATNVGRFVELLPGVRLVGLCDAGERKLFARAIRSESSCFVCDRDLEDELVRALGIERVEAIIDEQHELASLRRLQQMPFHRGGEPADHLRRFFGSRSGRKQRYAPLLVEALEPVQLPLPLRSLLDALVEA